MLHLYILDIRKYYFLDLTFQNFWIKVQNYSLDPIN